MNSTHVFTIAEDWLEWFATTQQTACRARLCAQYHLNALDADALMNTVYLQVFLHWGTIEHPLAYFWHTLQRAVWKHGQRRTYERRHLAAYARQHQVQVCGATRSAQQVTNLLEQVSPRQRRLLEWSIQGYDDTQVAMWLTTTPQAVRVARHSTYCTLRTQRRLSKGGGHHQGRSAREKEFFGAA